MHPRLRLSDLNGTCSFCQPFYPRLKALEWGHDSSLLMGDLVLCVSHAMSAVTMLELH